MPFNPIYPAFYNNKMTTIEKCLWRAIAESPNSEDMIAANPDLGKNKTVDTYVTITKHEPCIWKGKKTSNPYCAVFCQGYLLDCETYQEAGIK